MTFGRENTEDYFIADEKKLISQAHEGEGRGDEIYLGFGIREYSVCFNGKRCRDMQPLLIYHSDDAIIYTSTHSGNNDCPGKPDRQLGYVGHLHPTYQANPDSSGLMENVLIISSE